MRRFADSTGLPWDAVVSRESWGTLYALFVPAGTGRTEPMRRALLRTEAYDQAERELDQLDDDSVRALFLGAEPMNDTGNQP